MSKEAINEERRLEILNEERYRVEVREIINRDALNRKETNATRIWGFLNSSFGLWFLSAVLISGISWSYKEWSEAQELDAQRLKQIIDQEVHRSKQILELDIEIALRTAAARTWLKLGKMENALGELNGDNRRFTEFRDVPLVVLTYKLLNLVPQHEKESVQNAHQLVMRMAEVEPILLTGFDVSPKDRNQAKQSFIEAWDAFLSADRWSRQFGLFFSQGG